MEAGLAEVANVPWRKPADQAYLDRYARGWTIWTVALTVPFVLTGVGLLAVTWMTIPVAAIAFVAGLDQPGAVRLPRRQRPAAEGGSHTSRASRSRRACSATCSITTSASSSVTPAWRSSAGDLGVWMVGEAGAILLPWDGKRAHCFCVRVTDPELPPSDRIAHLLLALRTDETGFATVANHAFAGAPWRVRRRLPKPMRPALDAARALARSPR